METIAWIILCIILLALYGINIFTYLANWLELVSKSVVNSTLDVAKGGKMVTDATSTELDRVIDTIDIQTNVDNQWCFVGETGNNRICAPVSNGSLCASKQLFSSNEICMNPSLR